MRVAGLLLAAGAGRRLGGPKALLAIDGEPLVRRAARALAQGGCDPVLVVAGAEHEQVAAVLGRPVIVNPDWAGGMGGSMRAGLDAFDGVVDAALVLLVDTPGIGAEAVTRVRVQASRGRVSAGSYAGRRGHPVALGRDLWPAVAAMAVGDTGAQPFLAAYPELVDLVEVGDVADPTDLDDAADVAAWLARRR